MTRSAACADYHWLDEATATWVMDHVDPGANFEDGGNGVARPGFARRTGPVLRATTLDNDHRVSIENASPESNPELNGYGDYLFFQYLARTYQPRDDQGDPRRHRKPGQRRGDGGGARRPRPDSRRSGRSSRRRSGTTTSAMCSTTGSRLDTYYFGLAAIYSPSAQAVQTTASTKLKTLEVDQEGPAARVVQAAEERPGDVGCLLRDRAAQHALRQVFLKFSDDSVSSLFFLNPARGAAQPRVHEGPGQAEGRPPAGALRGLDRRAAEKQLCRDRKDGRVEEMLL